MQQRGTFSICTLILIALEQKPQTRTRVMQKLILSYPRTNRYLETLVKQHLICYDPITRAFDITPKGRKILILNQQLATYISPVNSMIRKYSKYIKDPYNDETDNYLNREKKELSYQNNDDFELLKKAQKLRASAIR
jgi:predicted transcriptional regulator